MPKLEFPDWFKDILASFTSGDVSSVITSAEENIQNGVEAAGTNEILSNAFEGVSPEVRAQNPADETIYAFSMPPDTRSGEGSNLNGPEGFYGNGDTPIVTMDEANDAQMKCAIDSALAQGGLDAFKTLIGAYSPFYGDKTIPVHCAQTPNVKAPSEEIGI